MQVNAAGPSRFFALVKALVLTEQHALGHVGVSLPAVRWVGFLNVDHKELDLVLELPVEFFHVFNLSTEWGSSIAAKNQGHRFLTLEAR